MVLDPQESPEETKSRDVELGSESWTSFASVVPQQQCYGHKVQALVYDILPSRCRKAMLGVCYGHCALRTAVDTATECRVVH